MTNEQAGTDSEQGKSASALEDALHGVRDDLRSGERPIDEPAAADEVAEAAGANDDDAATRVDRLERRVAALESELDAVRGLLGGVETVDEAVEQRASIALAKVEALEREFAAADPGVVTERLAGRTGADSPSDSAPATDPRAAGSTGPAAPASAGRSAADSRASSASTAPVDRDDADSGDDGLAARLRSALR